MCRAMASVLRARSVGCFGAAAAPCGLPPSFHGRLLLHARPDPSHAGDSDAPGWNPSQRVRGRPGTLQQGRHRPRCFESQPRRQACCGHHQVACGDAPCGEIAAVGIADLSALEAAALQSSLYRSSLASSTLFLLSARTAFQAGPKTPALSMRCTLRKVRHKSRSQQINKSFACLLPLTNVTVDLGIFLLGALNK
jgi:hypothetical protein